MKRRYFLLSLTSLSLVTGCAALQENRAQTPPPTQPQSAPARPETPAQSPPQQTPANPGTPTPAATIPVFAENGVAIGGTDPVAYFQARQPVLGSEEFSHTWQGVTWRFASAENRDLFIANPEQYAPQYGGFCAFAVARGYTASTVPEAWTIVDNKLYLNFSLDIRTRWERDIPGNIARGNQNWPEAAKDFRA